MDKLLLYITRAMNIISVLRAAEVTDPDRVSAGDAGLCSPFIFVPILMFPGW